MITPQSLNNRNDAAFADALPGQTQHQGVELGAAQTHPRRGVWSRPDEVALMQSACGQPDADAVVHQHLQPKSGSCQSLNR